jgi:deoxyribonucleoside regulator
MRNKPSGEKNEKIDLLVEIARAYYEQGHDQDMIARSMGISRSQVSRYLSHARDLNLVQVRVVAPGDRMSSMEKAIKKTFPGLREAVITPAFNTSPEVLRKSIGRTAASYFQELIRPGAKICIGSGRSLRELVNYLRPGAVPNISIIQAMGNVGHEAMQIDFNELALAAARAFDARVHYVNAPAILGSGSVKELVKDNPTINQALRLARSADMYLFGVGSMESDIIFTRNNMIKTDELEELRSAGAIGDICARFFDLDGNEIQSDFCERIVGIQLSDLKNSNFTFCVAGGNDKVLPLIGAMRGGYIKHLVIDEQTAGAIINHMKMDE